MTDSSLVSGPKGGMEKTFEAPSTLKATAHFAARLGATRVAGAASTAAVVGVEAAQTAAGLRFDPAPAYLFYLEMGGLIVGAFTECSGLEMEREIFEVQEGGFNYTTHKFGGPNKFSNIVLKRGLDFNRSLWSWYNEGLYDSRVLKLNFSIIVGGPMQGLSFDGFAKVRHWDVYDGIPVKWTGPELDTSSTDVAVEEIEIAHHGLEMSLETIVPGVIPFNPLAMAMMGDFA